MKIAILDTYYPAVIDSLPIDPDSTYDAELAKIMHRSFGTADFYSRNLRSFGWDAVDVIVNHAPLQELWAREHGIAGDPLRAQLEYHKPEVVFLQDLSIALPVTPKILAGQCSCPMPSNVPRLDVIFTSFPHYVPQFEKQGIRAVYNPLAFDPIVLERLKDAPRERIHDVVFIGGVGAPSHWRYGMEVLNAVAEAIPTFQWWGYGADLLPSNSALRQKYQGEAWGLDMYSIMLQSKMVLNRHGEVAAGFTNNMRTFEATGCGALLLTEQSPNIGDFFVGDGDFFDADEYAPYTSPADAVETIRFHLERWDSGLGPCIAENGARCTLNENTYARRMKTVSDVLNGML